MCGILGGWFEQDRQSDHARMAAGLAALAHRGPDNEDQASFFGDWGAVTLGHRRLSIIDLSPGGHQPKSSPDGRFVLVFNGEIYNYRELREQLRSLGHTFETKSDAEVLLACWAQWGRECLPRLRGMFAFVVYDTARHELICVRDAFGIKPLYYHQQPDAFVFSSELPALLTLLPGRPRINWQRAYDYLVHGDYDDQADTFLSGVQQLPPGHVLRIGLTSREPEQPQRWWWPSIAKRQDLTFEQAAEKLREMFLENIRLHLRSDVPLGATLSGGLDSASVVCAMRQIEPDMPIHTFNFAARGSRVDEEPWANMVNRHVNATAHKVLVTPEELASDIDDMIRSQGEPFGSTSIYGQYRVFKLAKQRGVTVALDGQGADELLAGYQGYPGPRMRSLLDGGRAAEALGFLRGWSRWPGRSLGRGALALGGQMTPAALRKSAMRLAGRNVAPAWLNLGPLQEAGVRLERLPIVYEADSRGRRLAATLRWAQAGHGLAALLRHADRNSMRWSLECRVPFLTTDMAEFLLRLPESYLVSPRGRSKRILRAAMRGIAPQAVLERRDKVGFATPERRWLAALGPRVDSWLEGIEGFAFLRATACRGEVKAIVGGKKGFDFRAWRLINFCRWAQLLDVS
ncbi:MAG: asparagine synthase (glutamine-hydrolyzing) [Proteobacteria bacterium]|nr:asparagine synthase (glutamine-hydrolyzing) [Pseudomonadota bacterium]MBU4383628.1 asparagine synthase (glutamine-hydrolyzing) [Pseudomonadota bacterium]MCG2763854.1 asparagine synthase (glutamine-hydrolyzing) [Desulfarculaceae bacterium]